MNELVNGRRGCSLPYIGIQEKPNRNLFVPVQSLGFEYQLTALLLSVQSLWAKSLNVIKFHFHTLRNMDASKVYCIRLKKLGKCM